MKQPQLLLIAITTLFLGTTFSFGQSEFGVYSAEEKNMKVYAKDPSAAAVYLFKNGNLTFEVGKKWIVTKQTVHVRVKVLKNEDIRQSTAKILIYQDDGTSQKIEGLQAMTYLNGQKHYVPESDMFSVDYSENYRQIKFTFPKVQAGAILEYKYTKVSPWIQHMDDWYFQSDIPVMYSQYHAEIPGNYTFNKSLIGNLPLDVNEVSLKKRCFYLPNSSDGADCENITLGMKDVPAFEYEEQFMLSPLNYLARLDFEISEYKGFDGKVTTYTKTWKSVDKQFKNDKDIGGQLTKKGFFEKNVPDDLFTEQDTLTKAKNIFEFVKQHYVWNGKFGRYGKARVKQAFDKRKGSAAEINMSLINLLNAADIKTNMMLLSTRDNGLVKKSYPVMKDFNYLVAYTKIGGKEYFLDATNRLMDFGRIPFKCLNHYGRVMDFEEASYWQTIIPKSGNKVIYRINLKYDEEFEAFAGAVDMIHMGYEAIDRRVALRELDNDSDKVLDQLDNAFGDYMEIEDYTLDKDKGGAERVWEHFDFVTDFGLEERSLIMNAFLIELFESNPFGLEERQFPVDFAHSKSWKFDVNLTLPEGFEIEQLPESQEVQLGNGLGTMKVKSLTQGQRAKLMYELTLKQSYFPTSMYQPLKEFFAYAVDEQKNATLTIRKSQSK